MADGTKIEWADASLNPIRARNKTTGKIGHYCEHASDGCRFCYSETFNRRGIGAGVAFQRQNRDQVELYLDEKMLIQPLRWRRPRRIFWNSMTDLFADFVPDEWIDRQMAVAALTPHHTHLFLTKRAKRMREYFQVTGSNDDDDAVHQRILTAAYDVLGQISKDRGAAEHLRDLCEASDTPLPLPNVWLGVSVEDQPRADERIPELLQTPAAVRFLSCEPLIGPVDIGTAVGWRGVDGFDPLAPRISWLIAGGESGPNARPADGDWLRSLRDQCAAAGVSFFFKQHGEWIDVRDLREIPGGQGPGFGTFDHCHYDREHEAVRVGKKAAGRLIDGVEHLEFPT